MKGRAASTNKRVLGESGFKNGKLEACPAAQPPKCPECASQKLWKDGLRYSKYGDVQRLLCRSCGLRFSYGAKKILYKPSSKGSTRQICVSPERRAKNLAEVEPLREGLAGATKQNADSRGKIVEFMWRLKCDGYQESTIQRYKQGLITLTRKGADIRNPESVKEIIGRQPWQEGTKLNYVNFYDAFVKFMGSKWERPKYKTTRKMPFIPLESEIDLLIHATRKKLSTILQTIKETGLRIGEVIRLQWTDIDVERNLIIVNDSEKGSKSGIYKVSTQLIQRILSLPRKREFIFGKGKHGTIAHFSVVRKRLAQEYKNPRLRQITFHTLRHWKATMEYHKTKDILHVKEMLRHRSIDNTLIYIHLEKALFHESSHDEFHVKVAHNLDEACELVKVGFEYVCDMDESKIFRKRK